MSEPDVRDAPARRARSGRARGAAPRVGGRTRRLRRARARPDDTRSDCGSSSPSRRLARSWRRALASGPLGRRLDPRPGRRRRAHGARLVSAAERRTPARRLRAGPVDREAGRLQAPSWGATTTRPSLPMRSSSSPRGEARRRARARRRPALDRDAADAGRGSRWAPSPGYRVAYREGETLRVVVGDGDAGDRLLAEDVAPVAPAWLPAEGRTVLAYAATAGRVHVVEADGKGLWSADPGARPEQLVWSDDAPCSSSSPREPASPLPR